MKAILADVLALSKSFFSISTLLKSKQFKTLSCEVVNFCNSSTRALRIMGRKSSKTSEERTDEEK